jgi:hypothetical protein
MRRKEVIQCLIVFANKSWNRDGVSLDERRTREVSLCGFYATLSTNRLNGLLVRRIATYAAVDEREKPSREAVALVDHINPVVRCLKGEI